MDYPLDLWFLIAEHIEPQVVGKFASICKSSFQVVTTATFWLNLYKRYNVMSLLFFSGQNFLDF